MLRNLDYYEVLREDKLGGIDPRESKEENSRRLKKAALYWKDLASSKAMVIKQLISQARMVFDDEIKYKKFRAWRLENKLADFVEGASHEDADPNATDKLITTDKVREAKDRARKEGYEDSEIDDSLTKYLQRENITEVKLSELLDSLRTKPKPKPQQQKPTPQPGAAVAAKLRDLRAVVQNWGRKPLFVGIALILIVVAIVGTNAIRGSLPVRPPPVKQPDDFPVVDRNALPEAMREAMERCQALRRNRATRQGAEARLREIRSACVVNGDQVRNSQSYEMAASYYEVALEIREDNELKRKLDEARLLMQR